MKIACLPGPIEKPFLVRLRALDRERFAERLWEKDAALWSEDPEARRAIENRLGWLDPFPRMESETEALRRFAGEARSEFKHALLLGMGGSSLAPEVLARTFGGRGGGIPLRVLDSTDPLAVRAAEEAVDLSRTLVIVASKSGSTAEVDAFRRYFASLIKDSRRFVAITDPGSPLDRLAEEEGWRFIYRNPADIGGRYSALSLFGLVPAALLGVDVRRLMEGGREAAAASGPAVPAEKNPGLSLGAFLAEGALAGRDKLTLLVSPGIPGFGAWVEQLVAESTGKEGKGILPVDGEPLGPPESYGSDRIFAVLACGGEDGGIGERGAALAAAGHPVASIRIADPIDLGGAFFLWEVATACASAVLGVNAFDEPNVKESKHRTGDLLAEYVRSGRLDEGDACFEDGETRLDSDVPLTAADGSGPGERLAAHLARARPGDYLGLLAFLAPADEVSGFLADLRSALRSRTGLATSAGYGPRFLHSTGQLFKGGANRGVFVQLTADDESDLSIPGLPYSFGVLKRAQALGDLAALRTHGRRVLRVHFKTDPAAGIRRLIRIVRG
ncbi:MAG: hypothetical protein ABIH26_05410 [Candidatus Eisenbacteria bacterium]